MSTHTPWGPSEHSEVLAPGITVHRTASHGGIHLDADRRAQIPASIQPFTRSRAWWEEDCDWAVVALVFPKDFTRHHSAPRMVLAEARKSLARYQPEWLQAIDRKHTQEAARLSGHMLIVQG
jgi:hypothetical protein